MTKMTITEAVESLTVGEVETIERHYGKPFPQGLSSVSLASSLVWAYERRRLLGHDDRPDWKDLESWTVKAVNDYFAEDEVEADPDDPETEAGKDDLVAA